MANPLSEDQDPNSGSSFLKRHMTEAQSDAKGSFGERGNAMLRDRMRDYRGDQYYEEKYGKGTDMSPGAEQTANRSRKGNKL